MRDKISDLLTITIFTKETDYCLPFAYFQLEQLCFAEKYAITPRNKSDFDNMFKHKTLIISVQKSSSLIGMAFIDYISSDLCYLRVICVHPLYRRQGICKILVSKIQETFLSNSITFIAFVSETDLIVRIFERAGFTHCSFVPKELAQKLFAYNKKLEQYQPRTSIPNYYSLKNGNNVDASYYLLRYKK